MMMLDVFDIYGKKHYFIPQMMVSVDEVTLKIKDDLGRDDTITCYAMTFVNDTIIYISEAVCNSFINQEPPVQPGQEELQPLPVEQPEIKKETKKK